MDTHHSVGVLWNPSAGSAEGAASLLKDLRTRPNTVVELPADGDEAQRIARRLAESVDLLVAAGGDGTVSCVVNALLTTSSPAILGLLPLGSGNDLARSLEIPFDPQAALDVLDHGTRQKIDVLQVSTPDQTRYCANMVTGGNTGRYLERMSDEIKKRWGAFSYLRGVVDVVQSLETFQVRVTCDDGTQETLELLNLFLSNGRTSGGGMVVSPTARLDDARLDVVMIRDGEPGDLAGLTADYFLSDHLQHPLVEFRRTSQVEIESAPDLPLTADGESVGTSPLTVKVIPSAVTVLTPAGPSACTDD